MTEVAPLGDHVRRVQAARNRMAELANTTSALRSQNQAIKHEAWKARLRAGAARDWAVALRMAKPARATNARPGAPVRSFSVQGELAGRPVQAEWHTGCLTGDDRLLTHAQLLVDMGATFVNADPPAHVKATLTGEPAAVMLTLAHACDVVTSVESEPA
jgi:hypothetical protein